LNAFSRESLTRQSSCCSVFVINECNDLMLRRLRPHLVRSITQSRSASKHAAGPAKDDWLLSKKNDELRQVAIECGTSCSGTKQSLVDGLKAALADCGKGNGIQGQDLSIISIDMGVRNLAYCSLQTRLDTVEAPNLRKQRVKVDAWRRIDTTGRDDEVSRPRIVAVSGQQVETLKPVLAKEDFSPTIYAERAHDFVSEILQLHNPTHVLIERQRFRSGGGPAVQEWTLRVGMFEFMLYATLHTLARQGKHSAVVVPVQPAMVNRYWLSQNDKLPATAAKPSSAAMKKYKIDLVARVLDDSAIAGYNLTYAHQARALKEDFLHKMGRVKGRTNLSSLPKLDDLSDSLLQGLAWISWQRNRKQLHSAMRPTNK
jgi:cruciform cutting endonuclease 1